jgi:hypothetical protein
MEDFIQWCALLDSRSCQTQRNPTRTFVRCFFLFHSLLSLFSFLSFPSLPSFFASSLLLSFLSFILSLFFPFFSSLPPQPHRHGLEEFKWSEDRIKVFQKCYEESKPKIRTALSKSAFSFGTILSLSYRLDHYLKSNTVDHVRAPLYYLTLKTQQANGETKEIQLTATLEELQDLLQKCKDMAKQVEKVLTVVKESS